MLYCDMDAVMKLTAWEKKYVFGTISFEQQFKRALPRNSFFKSVAIDILRKNGIEVWFK